MKKRLLLISTSLFSVITLAIGVVSFSYAWLAQEPKYHFTITTGDYPLLVKSNLYTPGFEYTDRQVSPDGTTSTNLDYQNLKLKLNKERYKSFNYDSNSIDIDSETGKTDASGTLTLSFKALTKNILDSTKILDTTFTNLSMIGNSSNGYALDNRYFYVAFIEFLFVKEFFDAYLKCEATSETKSNLFKYTFLDSDQTDKSQNKMVNFINGTVKIDEQNKTSLYDVSLSDQPIDALFNRTPESSLKNINDPENNGNIEFKKISPLATKVANEICYSYAVVYGIYVDPAILLSKNPTKLEVEGTLKLSFKFTLSDSSVAYEDNTSAGS